MSIVYLNGEYLPLEEARISVLDRGFLFADGVYEVFPSYNGKPFRLNEHLSRLDNSLAGIYMSNPLSKQEWAAVFAEVIARNTGRHQSLYLQLTRGISPRDHLFSDDIKPTVFVMSKPLEAKTSNAGIAAITCEDPRWKHCDLKTIALLPGVMLRHEARTRGATEAILYREGRLTEGAASNVFVISVGVVRTPPRSRAILPGVTRDLVVELLRGDNVECREEEIDIRALDSADEIWITSSTWEIVPVISLNDRVVGSGEPGPLYRQANALYQDIKENY